jgi:chitinase
MEKRLPPLVLAALGAALALAGCRTFAPIPVVGEDYRIPPGFRVVGYFPSWSGDPAEIQYRALTHIDYAFLTPTAQGGYLPVPRAEKLAALIEMAHAHGVKVLASLGGADDGIGAFETIATDPQISAVFIDNTMALVAGYGLDGIDMDWEFPAMKVADEYAVLMHCLAERLHAAGCLLTAAVSAGSWHGGAIRGSVIEDVDFLNVMAYDDGYRQPGVHHSTYDFAWAAMRYWLNDRGASPSKVILGVPFYGRSLKDRHSRTFKSILARDCNAPGKDVSGEFGYNGFATLRDKALRLAHNLGGGVMIWQIAQDAPGTTSLLNAIFDAIKVPREGSPD